MSYMMNRPMAFNTSSTNAYEGYAVSIGYVRVLFDYMAQQGFSPDQVCAPLRVNEFRVADSNARCPLNEWHDLMGAAEVLMGDAHLALTLSEHIKPWHAGLVGFMAMTSGTLRDVGKVLAHYHHFLNDVESVEVGLRGNCFVLAVPQLTSLNSQRISMITLGSWAWHARWLTGRHDLVFDADFAFPKPGRLDTFERVFGGALRFNQPHSALAGALPYLDLRVIQQEPTINRILLQQAERQKDQLAESAGSFLAKLERLLSTHLGHSEVSLSALAAEMQISPRTLQNRLEDTGLSFRTVVERVRKNQAINYLNDSRLSLMQIALMLGFANQTSFHHAFKRWTGQSPGEFRRFTSGP
jgi:AraC-like DNA-binding protein